MLPVEDRQGRGSAAGDVWQRHGRARPRGQFGKLLDGGAKQRVADLDLDQVAAGEGGWREAQRERGHQVEAIAQGG